MKSISLFVDNGTYLTKIHPFTKLMYIATAISIPLITGSALDVWCSDCRQSVYSGERKDSKKNGSADCIFFHDSVDHFPDSRTFQPEKYKCAVSDRTAQVLPGGSALCTANRAEHFKYASLFWRSLCFPQSRPSLSMSLKNGASLRGSDISLPRSFRLSRR